MSFLLIETEVYPSSEIPINLPLPQTFGMSSVVLDIPSPIDSKDQMDPPGSATSKTRLIQVIPRTPSISPRVQRSTIIQLSPNEPLPSHFANVPISLENSNIVKVEERENRVADDSISCPFIHHGCRRRGPKKEIKLHVRDDRIYHMMLTAYAITQVRASLLHVAQTWAPVNHRLQRGILQGRTVTKKFNCQRIMVIHEFVKKVERAKKSSKHAKIISEEFVTHRFGYTIAIIFMPRGDNTEVHSSIFATLIASTMDPILAWPFILPITFTIISPTGNNYSRTFDPSENELQGANNRPQSGRNPAFGIKKFCPIGDLPDYIVDGTLYISIDIDLHKMPKNKEVVEGKNKSIDA